MKLLQNLFEAHDDHDYRLLDGYLSRLSAEYLSNHYTPPTIPEKALKSIHTFQPSQILAVRPNSDFFDELYASGDENTRSETNKTDSKLRTKKTMQSLGDDSELKRDMSPDPFQTRQIEIKAELLPDLGRIFTLLDSKSIRRLLVLLEHPKKSTRRLMVLLFQVLLQRKKNKVHFVEKCAIGYSGGTYLLSRLKYAHGKCEDAVQIFGLLSAIKRSLRSLEVKLRIEGVSIPGNFLQLRNFFSFFWSGL